MELFLMVAAMSLLGVAASVAIFAAATHGEERAPHYDTVEETVLLGTPRFFAASAPAHQAPAIPIEILLLQIARHVQLEQAAAESFHDAPTPQALHMPTMSPLVH